MKIVMRTCINGRVYRCRANGIEFSEAIGESRKSKRAAVLALARFCDRVSAKARKLAEKEAGL